MKTALTLLNNLVRIIYADEYDKLDIPMLRVSLTNVMERFLQESDTSMNPVFESAMKRLNERQEADRLKPEQLTELMLSKLTMTELNDILSDIVEAGSISNDNEEKIRLRGTYKKVLEAMKGRTQ